MEAKTVKPREWSPRLCAIAERAKRGRKIAMLYLFPNRCGQAYSKSGWISVWQDTTYTYIAALDPVIARHFEPECKREAAR